MGLFKKIFNKAGYKSKADVQAEMLEWQRSRTQRVKEVQRAWNAARVTRFNTGWSAASGKINDDIKNDLPALRSRIKELRQNNPDAISYGNMLRMNVVGSKGFTLQPMALLPNGDYDKTANDLNCK